VELWNNPRVPRLAVLIAAICFGTTGTAQALGPEGLSPLGVGAARIAVGGLVLALLARAVVAAPSARAARAVVAAPSAPPARAVVVHPSARGPWPARIVLAAVAGVATYQLAFFAAVSEGGVAVGTVVAIGSGPALAGLLERVLLGRALTARWAIATGLAAAGVALLALGGGAAARVTALGVLLAVLAGGAYATYTVAAKRLLELGRAPESVMAVAFGLGAVVLLPVLLVTGAGWLATPGGAALALYLGLVPTALAYVLFARGLRRLPAAEAATLTLAEPLTAALLGALVLGESLGPIALAGAALVLGGLVVLALPRAAPRVAVAPAP